MRVETTRGPEHFHGRLIVDVVAAFEGFDERLVAREMRQHAKLDLRVVRGNEDVAGVRDERAADLASELGPNRNVLKVRIAAAQTARGSHRLVERRVHATRDRIDELRQGVDVGALQFLQSAPLEHEAWHLMCQSELLEYLDRR